MFVFLFCLALLGTLTSTIYFSLVVKAAFRFHFRRKREVAELGSRPREMDASLPPVTLLKPVHGAEPGLREYLESFYRLDYPKYEILFCARTDEDAGLRLAKEVAAAHPEIPTRFLLSGNPPWPNARCYSLSVMAPAASHDILVITDSDVRVRPEFLKAVMYPFQRSEIGAATCVYCGYARGMGLSALFEGLGMSVEMTGGVLVADMLEGMKFTLGPAMIIRKAALNSFGGFEKLGYYYADDFMLGNMTASHGWEVALSSHVIDHCIVNNSFKKNFSHQWSWMKSTRFSRPAGHFGTVLTFCTPFGLLGLLAGFGLGHPLWGAVDFLWTYLVSMSLCLVAGGWIIRDRDAFRFSWLYPARDFMGFVLWCLSYTSRRVGWRDDQFVLEKGGLMRKINSSPKSAKATVR